MLISAGLLLLAGVAIGEERHVKADLVANGSSGVSGFVQLTQLPHGGTNLHGADFYLSQSLRRGDWCGGRANLVAEFRPVIGKLRLPLRVARQLYETDPSLWQLADPVAMRRQFPRGMAMWLTYVEQLLDALHGPYDLFDDSPFEPTSTVRDDRSRQLTARLT